VSSGTLNLAQPSRGIERKDIFWPGSCTYLQLVLCEHVAQWEWSNCWEWWAWRLLYGPRLQSFRSLHTLTAGKNCRVSLLLSLVLLSLRWLFWTIFSRCVLV